MFSLRFESTVRKEKNTCWNWIVSVDGIRKEMFPLIRMTHPSGVSDITVRFVNAGQPLYNSWMLLFGFIPIDMSRLTMISIDKGESFVESSQMLTMKTWRHKRTLFTAGTNTKIVDELEFEPRFLPSVTAWFITRIFRLRHRNIMKHLG